jgi:hypothetical protein
MFKAPKNRIVSRATIIQRPQRHTEKGVIVDAQHPQENLLHEILHIRGGISHAGGQIAAQSRAMRFLQLGNKCLFCMINQDGSAGRCFP